jgi:hypothetical protein
VRTRVRWAVVVRTQKKKPAHLALRRSSVLPFTKRFLGVA